MKLKKIFKKTRKRVRKSIRKGKRIWPGILTDIKKDINYMYKELSEEAEDFFDDFYEDIFHKKKFKIKKLRRVNLYGCFIAVRPAYVFAERVENILKIVFGISIFVSGILATFWGFTRTSDLLTALIGSIPGRIIVIVIGFSYFILGLWKLLHLKR